MVQVDWLFAPSNGSPGGTKTPGLHTYNACLLSTQLHLCFLACMLLTSHCCRHRSNNHTHVHVVQVTPCCRTIHQGHIQLPDTAEPCALHAMTCRACVHITHAMYVLCGGQPRLCRCNPCTHSISVSHISIRARVYIR